MILIDLRRSEVVKGSAFSSQGTPYQPADSGVNATTLASGLVIEGLKVYKIQQWVIGYPWEQHHGPPTGIGSHEWTA